LKEQNKIFRPKNARAVFVILLMPLLFFACVFFTYTKASKFRWDIEGLLLVIFGSLTMILFVLLRTIPKEIWFENKIIVKRYFYKDLIIEYSEIVDLDTMNLVAKNGSITLAYMRNRYELIKIIEQLIDEKKIKITGKLRKKEERDLIVTTYSAIPALATYFLLLKIFGENISKTYLYLLSFIVWIFFYKLIDRAFSKHEEQ
jgi:hypothetical protein